MRGPPRTAAFICPNCARYALMGCSDSFEVWYVLLMAAGQAGTVFISYAHQDGAALAEQLHRDLALRGWDVWLDAGRLTAGASWTVEIEQALDRSDFVLA